MAKRIFISFAIEDESIRNMLVGQKKNPNSPIEFADWSVHEPWDSSWKTKCRERIKKCAGLLVIVTKNTKKADGQLWEVKCANEEGLSIRGINGYKDDNSKLDNVTMMNWTWDNIKNWINSL